MTSRRLRPPQDPPIPSTAATTASKRRASFSLRPSAVKNTEGNQTNPPPPSLVLAPRGPNAPPPRVPPLRGSAAGLGSGLGGAEPSPSRR